MQTILIFVAKRKCFSLIHRFPLFSAHDKIHRCFSSSSSSSSTQPPIFIVDYLVDTFGFSPDKAAKVSKRIAHLKSPQNPDSVRYFLNHHGFSEDHIKTLVTGYPRILCSSPENTLYSNLRALRELGLSTSALTQIILSDSATIRLRSAVPRINFWKDYLGGSEAALLKAFRTNRGLGSNDVAPKISLLQSHHGLSTHEIRIAVLTVPRFITSSIHTIQDILKRAQELGFQPGSANFVGGIDAVTGNSREGLQKKMELLKSFGWSEDDFFSALRKSPTMVSKSEKNIQTKMDFFIGEVRYDASYIASNPDILTSSLEKRLKPRHQVLHLLKSKGFHSKGYNFFSIIKMTDNKFVERYILPYKKEISGLHESYLAACA